MLCIFPSLFPVDSELCLILADRSNGLPAKGSSKGFKARFPQPLSPVKAPLMCSSNLKVVLTLFLLRWKAPDGVLI